mgnify:CR=1 FL=1
MENALSCIYVGYHFRNACRKGVEQGNKVGKYVFENYLERKVKNQKQQTSFHHCNNYVFCYTNNGECANDGYN